MILFIGDKPSKHNIDPGIAFVGTRSWDTLQKWVNYITDEPCMFINRTDCDFDMHIKLAGIFESPIIALGNEASKALKAIPHFKLPHPSGLNRKLNDKNYIKTQLNLAKMYINGQ